MYLNSATTCVLPTSCGTGKKGNILIIILNIIQFIL